ncbi:T9SS type A sorting domain-containing protein [Ferruginibacter sp.]
MKEFIILFFTFLGICKGFAQNPVGNNLPDSLQNIKALTQKKIADSSFIKERVSVKLFPNPAKNKVELEVKGFEAGLIQLQIIDISGKLERNDQRLLVSGNENIVVMFSLKPGIYFITVKQKDKLAKKKMIVQ